ncbi:polyprenyl synthetase family protein [Streptomyces sp. NPDC006692]|uniref:polyprenyl synthetase family protein n=1 Tax=Streptomyces sp. NPDC006692 TaxID=3364758 RepID=UPI0036B9EAFE
MSNVVGAMSVPVMGPGRGEEPEAAVLPGSMEPPWARLVQEALDDLYAPCPQATLTARLCAPTTLGDMPADVAERADRRLHEALVRPVRYLVEAGGARLRPRLLLAAIDLLGGDVARYTPLAAAMELMHTGSLMVDDVQDGATLRRGRAPSHAVFGQATALNAGTAAYFAFDHALRSTLPEDAALRAAVTETCLGVLRSAHAGQGLDLEGHQAEMDAAVAAGCGREVQHLVRLTHRLKSGAPVRACMETAALLTGAGKDVQAALGAFGEAVGVSYQIIDDVLDLDGVVRGGTATKRPERTCSTGRSLCRWPTRSTCFPRPAWRDCGTACATAARANAGLSKQRRCCAGAGRWKQAVPKRSRSCGVNGNVWRISLRIPRRPGRYGRWLTKPSANRAEDYWRWAMSPKDLDPRVRSAWGPRLPFCVPSYPWHYRPSSPTPSSPSRCWTG